MATGLGQQPHLWVSEGTTAGIVDSSFGPRLRRLREDAGLSLRQLATRLHYDPGYLSKIENGLKRPSVELARACDQVLATSGVLTAACGRTVATAAECGSRSGAFDVAVVRSLPGAFGQAPVDGPATGWDRLGCHSAGGADLRRSQGVHRTARHHLV